MTGVETGRYGETMLGGLNNSTWPVALTASVAAVCVAVGCREVIFIRRRQLAYLWPTFWFTTAILLLVMAFGQASDVGDLLADAGRREALRNSWYEDRRSAQAIVVAAVATLWAIMALVTIWRVPERRRRYLPMALIVLSLVCFGAIRVVSLHQIDELLFRRHIGDVEIGRAVELVGLSLALIVATTHLTMWPRFPIDVERTFRLNGETAQRNPTQNA